MGNTYDHSLLTTIKSLEASTYTNPTRAPRLIYRELQTDKELAVEEDGILSLDSTSDSLRCKILNCLVSVL